MSCQDHLRFPEVIVPICVLITKFLKFLQVKSDLIFETSTPKDLQIPNFSQLVEGVWELQGVPEIC